MPNQANQPTVLVLRADTAPFKDAVVMGQGLPMEKDGHPVAYKWKESLRLGRYLDRDHRPFDITPQRVENLIRNFHKAKAKGFTPPILDRHEKTGSAAMGFVVDARRGPNGSLELLHQFIGDDAVRAAARNKTSICTVANVTDENGETYDELIDHQALIPDPQLNSLSDFTPALAASRGQSQQPVLVLELAASEPQESAMDLTKLREAIGAAKDTSDADVVAAAAAKLAEAVPALELSRSQTGTIATLTQERDDARQKLAAATRQVDPDVLADRADLMAEKIDLCLSRGQCTKAQADILKAALKDGDKPAVLMLSKTGPAGTPIDVALKVLELNRALTGTASLGQPVADPNNPPPSPTAIQEGRDLGQQYQQQALAARGLA